MLRGINRGMTVALVAGLALTALVLQSVSASAAPRRHYNNGNAAAVAAFAAVPGRSRRHPVGGGTSRRRGEQAGHRPALVISPSSYNRRVGLAVRPRGRAESAVGAPRGSP